MILLNCCDHSKCYHLFVCWNSDPDAYVSDCIGLVGEYRDAVLAKVKASMTHETRLELVITSVYGLIELFPSVFDFHRSREVEPCVARQNNRKGCFIQEGILTS